MIPLIPALILAFISFIASAFVILRIVIPILPPHSLSKRVSPAEFGLPTFRSLSPADKSHLWLASLDLVALALFIWQIVNESTAGPSGVALATDPGSAIRLWILVTIRQTCLLFVAGITLLHVRMAHSVSFGASQWMLWAPTALLVFTSTTVAGILSGTGVKTLFFGMTAYTITIAVLSTIAFGCLIRTLFAIRKNLAAIDESNAAWGVQVEEPSRPSFATEEIDAMRDGTSWMTSTNGSSRRNSASAWSFSTHHTVLSSHHGRAQTATHPSVPAKSSFWFNGASSGDIQIPPVPPLPSPFGPLSPTMAEDDPFRRDLPVPKRQRWRYGSSSQDSWLTSSAGSHTTVTAWSYPATGSHYEHSIQGETVRNPTPQDFHTSSGTRPFTPAMADAQVLGGYGFAPGGLEEKGLTSFASSVDTSIEISMLPAYGWSVMIWLPLSFALPYFITLIQNTTPSTVMQVLFILSVTLSSPLLAINLLCGSPLPIPVGLFDSNNSLPVDPNRPMIHGSFPPHKFSHEYKRSTSCSVTVVEARRSGDVWLSKGNAVDGKSKLGRAVGMLQARPKLSVLPPEDNDDALEEPPVPFGDDSTGPFHGTPRSEVSAQFGKLRSQSRTGSHQSSASEHFATRIMVAQRHYSALAQTVVVPGPNSPVNPRDSVGAGTLVGASSGVASKRNSNVSHLRSRSTGSSIAPTQAAQEHYNPSPPPSFPLPPTPPSVRSARLALLAHKKSFSSGFSLGADLDTEMNEIDALTAGVLPLLVPGLKVGNDMKIKNGDYTPPGSFTKSKGRKTAKRLAEFGADMSPPVVHTTPAAGKRRQTRSRKESGHKKNHFSLPSLSLGREGVQSLATWGSDIRNAFDTKVGQYVAVPTNVDLGHSRRNTVDGLESVLNQPVHLGSVQEEENTKPLPSLPGLGRTMSTRSMGLRADVPHDVDTARSSVTSLTNIPPSAASTITLFEDFEAELISSARGESTPHSSLAQKPVVRNAPPPMPNYRRSSAIYYKKSPVQEEYPTHHDRFEETYEARQPEAPVSTITTFAQRAVRLIPKASKLQRSPTETASPNLRTLTLLQDRGNTNLPSSGRMSPPTAEIRPLTIGKAQKVRRAPAPLDENGAPVARTSSNGSRNKNLKSLTLVRSETSKMRGVLRRTEVVPDVVVRPPSGHESHPYAYNFRD